MGRDVERTRARINKTPVWIGGGVTVAAALLVRMAVGSPHAALWQLGATDRLPPLWILSALWLGCFFLVGCAWGYLLGACPKRGGCAHDAAVWRGSLCLVLSLVFSFLWFALLVGSLSLFLSEFLLVHSVVKMNGRVKIVSLFIKSLLESSCPHFFHSNFSELIN